MATVTPNFNWPVPTSTDLVKDGATAIEALGDSIDASLVDLKGGTTGQVLAKQTNTDMDFVWVAQDDSNAIQNSIVDAKGDLIAATANDTPARLAVGANGETLVADSSTSTGLRYTSNFAAGKNKVINGDMGVWQRGTSITLPSGAAGTYGADRFIFEAYGSSTAATVTRQTFTPGTAPVAGYEGQYFARLTNFATATAWQIRHRIENVQTFAGQTVTFSFWAKASASMVLDQIQVVQNFGSGGSGSVTTLGTAPTLTTSWVRYQTTVSVPSIAGKTIGTSSYLEFTFYQGSGATNSSTIDIWGVQAEAGSVATAFQTATGTIQGELAACQRYYYRCSPASTQGSFGMGIAGSSTSFEVQIKLPVTMRVAPTSVDFTTIGNYRVYNNGSVNSAASGTPSIGGGNTMDTGYLVMTSSSMTAGSPYFLGANNTSNVFLGFGAEL